MNKAILFRNWNDTKSSMRLSIEGFTEKSIQSSPKAKKVFQAYKSIEKMSIKNLELESNPLRIGS